MNLRQILENHENSIDLKKFLVSLDLFTLIELARKMNCIDKIERYSESKNSIIYIINCNTPDETFCQDYKTALVISIIKEVQDA